MSRAPTIAVILAAGGSTRMVTPKALLPMGTETFLSAHIRRLQAAGLPVRVAVGAHRARIEAVTVAAGGVPFQNEAWASTGPFDSLRICAADLTASARLLVTPVDVPPAPIQTIRSLVAEPGPVVPLSRGVEAHPVIVEARAVQQAAPGVTLRQVLLDAPRVPARLPDGTRNLNTPEDLRRWQSAVAARR